MINIKAGKMAVTFSDDLQAVHWGAEGLPLKEAEGADFWRLYLDDGDFIGIPICSQQQRGSITEVCSGVDIQYDSLSSNDGKIYQIELTVHIRVEDEKICFSATVSNQDHVRVNEVKLPFMDLESIGSMEREKDVLYRAMGFGERIPDPWNSLEAGHSDYMYDDQKETWLSMEYPSFGSMAWHGIESDGHFLYMGRHDELFRSCVLAAGKGPRGSKPRLIMAVSHFPLLQKGECEVLAKVAVALMPGDWRLGAAIYRKWAEETWWEVPDKPAWVKELSGWQRIILKHQYGEILYRYEDLPLLYEEGKKVGLDMLLVFGWWKGRFDNSYPHYEADPALGGEEALRSAIAEIQGKGGRVALYTNGVLIDVQSEFFKEKGYKICRKDIDGNEYREHYRFGNEGMLLRTHGYKSFVSACQATEEWKQQLLDQGRIKLKFNPDSIFYDQIGGHFPRICFDASHKHGSRGDREAIWRRENLAAMRSLCTGERALGTEFVVDFSAPFIDYHHSVIGGEKRKFEFPALFRHTFPEVILTNRGNFDESKDYQRQLNYAFVYGMRYCVSIFRCREGIHVVPEYGEHLQKLLELRRKYAEFFYYGRFTVETDLQLPEEVVKTEYVSGNSRLFVFWNDSAKKNEFEFYGRNLSLQPNEIICEKVLF